MINTGKNFINTEQISDTINIYFNHQHSVDGMNSVATDQTSVRKGIGLNMEWNRSLTLTKYNPSHFTTAAGYHRTTVPNETFLKVKTCIFQKRK